MYLAMSPRRAADRLASLVADVTTYDAITHFDGQSTVLLLADERARGEPNFVAERVTAANGRTRLTTSAEKPGSTWQVCCLKDQR
jgi:hypothetical protein